MAQNKTGNKYPLEGPTVVYPNDIEELKDSINDYIKEKTFAHIGLSLLLIGFGFQIVSLTIQIISNCHV